MAVKAHNCTECGKPHVVQDSHKESLTKIKCNMLKAAAALVVSTGRNDFKKSDLPSQNHSEYANFQKLRYHGLIAQVRTNGVKMRDHWLITRNGWAFLRGELKLPKFVLVQDNSTLEYGRSDVLVSLLDVLQGGDYMETRFEYFDEDTGAMVGLRPAQLKVYEQTSLM